MVTCPAGAAEPGDRPINLLPYIAPYQTLIVGVVGFLGVIITLATNAWLHRRQYDRQITHDGKILRVALRAELELIRDAFRERIKVIEAATQDGARNQTLKPLETMTDVYGALIDRIGLLSEAQVLAAA